MISVQLRRIQRLEGLAETLTELERARKARPTREERQRRPEGQTNASSREFGDLAPALQLLTRHQSPGIVAAICVLSLWGSPCIDEPLDRAWQRCRQSEKWKSVRARHPHFGQTDRDEEGHPCTDTGAKRIGDYFFSYILPDLPGEDTAKRIDLIIAEAPRWLLWHAYADIHLEFLELKPVDLSKMKSYPRDITTFLCGALPEGPFEVRPRLARDDFKGVVIPADYTPRERKRLLKNLERSAEEVDEPTTVEDQINALKAARRRKYGC